MKLVMEAKSEQAAPYLAAVDVDEGAIISRAIAILDRRAMCKGAPLGSGADAKDYLRLKFADHEHEVFCCLFLDNRNRVLAFEELFRGTIDGTAVYPREVVRRALSHNAAAVIFAHNHPSGVPEPSRADEVLTQRLKEALTLLGIRVLDHVVVGTEGIVSFAERGLI